MSDLEPKIIGKHLVYPDGRIWSLRFKKFVQPHFSKYGRIRLTQGNAYVHRLVAGAFVPNPENKLEVNHKDGDTRNNHYSNLEWVTPLENKRHAFTAGLIDHRGEKNAHSWLTKEAVLLIRELVELGHTQRQVAQWFGLHSPAVCEIVSGKRWGHV